MAAAEERHGVLTRRELVELGWTPQGIMRAERSGRLSRVHRGVYRVAGAPAGERAQLRTAALAMRGAGGVGFVTAAALHGFWGRHDGSIHLVTGGWPITLDDATVHRSTTLRDRDLLDIDAIRATTVPRTLLDSSDLCTPWQVANMLHEAAFHRMLDLAVVAEQLERARGRRAGSVLARALELWNEGSAGTMSPLEDRALARVLAAGCPEPLVNRQVVADGSTFRVDMHWPTLGVVVETDGSGHGRPPCQQEDERRDQALLRDGWTVRRWTARDVRRRSDRWIRNEVLGAHTATATTR